MRTEAVGLLAAGLAHDLNNMLGGIVATAELLAARGPRRGEDSRDLDAIVDQAVKASRLIRQILAFSRQELLKPVTTDVGIELARLLPMLQALAGRAITLEAGPPADPSALVRIDPTALERVIVNLVMNAREALAPGGGRIRIEGTRLGPGHRPETARAFLPEAPFVVISVEDDGPGIAPAIAGRIFEPYFTTRPDGQGLGLATAYGLVKQSGGWLLHDRGPMGGARFQIWLPESRPEPAPPVIRRRFEGRVILLVEDELLLRMSTARGLERLGYRVRQAADGDAALARLAEARPALLVSDIRMPGLDGIALTIAARERHPGLPILLTTGYADEAARAAVPGLDVGVLEKPYTLRGLEARIAELL